MNLGNADTWMIVLKDVSGSDAPEVGRRVARLLKIAGRQMGLKCLECSATTLPEQLERLQDEVLELREQLARAERKASQRRAAVGAS